MRAFVTGSTGLLGSNLVSALVAEGWEVRALARDPAKAAAQLGHLPRVEVVRGDLEDVAGFARQLEGVDVVFHTAAYFREYYGTGDHEATLQRLNVDATVALARAAGAAGVRRLVHTSSSGTLAARPDGGPVTEEDVADPGDLDNLYFRSKVRADRALAEAAAELDLEIVTVLPGWMWGPGDAAPTSAGQLVRDHLAGKLPPVALPGGTALVDARDVADAMVRMATDAADGDRFVVAGRTVSLPDVLAGLARLTGDRGPRFTLPWVPALAFAWTAQTAAALTGTEPIVTVRALRTLQHRHDFSSARAQEQLGTTFRPLEETLRDALDWQRAHLADAGAAAPRPVAT